MQLNAQQLDVPLAISSSILNLHGWRVTAITEKRKDYVVEAEHEAEAICPKCRGIDLVRFGVRDQEYHDLPVHMKRVTIMVHRQRYRCKSCDFTFVLPIPHMHEKRMMTERLIEYIQHQCLVATFTSIGNQVGLDESTIRDVFGDYAKELAQSHVIETPEWLGIDEVYLGRQMRCVFTDVRNRKPIEMLPFRVKESVEAFIAGLDRPKIEGVVMDMWSTYRTVAQELLPNAVIVVDKYHIIRMANQALEKVRKGTREEMPHAQRKQLKQDRKILLKRNADLTDQQKFILSTWLLNFETLGKAYAAKEAFITIWSSDDREIAEFLYEEWLKGLDIEIQPAFSDVIRAVKNWHQEIFNYFDYPFTNAYTEATNGMIKQIQQAGRGYSFDVIRAKMVHGLGNNRDGEIVPPDWW